MQAFELMDGGLTRDRAEAEWDRRKRIAARQQDVDAAIRTLLKLPVAAEGSRPTPSRIEAVKDLLAARVLPAYLSGLMATVDFIDDESWRSVAGVRDLMHPVETEQHGWSFALLEDSGRALPIPGDYDPLHDEKSLLPADPLCAILRALRRDGWGTTSVSVTWETESEQPSIGLLPGEDAISALRFDLESATGAGDYERSLPYQ